MRRSLSQIQESRERDSARSRSGRSARSGRSGRSDRSGRSGERGMLGSVLRRRTLPRFFSMVACGRGATGSGGAGRSRASRRRRRAGARPALGFLQHRRLPHTHVSAACPAPPAAPPHTRAPHATTHAHLTPRPLTIHRPIKFIQVPSANFSEWRRNSTLVVRCT